MIIYGGPKRFLLDSWRRYALPVQLAELKRQLLPWERDRKPSPEERKSQLVQQKMFEQLTYLAKVYTPYTFYECRFQADNAQELHRSMGPADQELFGFDLTAFSWEDYLGRVHIPGLRRFVLKGRA